MRGRDVLKEGLIWTIGNGANINVWDDRWIPRPTRFKLITNVLGENHEARVIDLIDWNVGQWDRDKVTNFFLPCDAEIILQLRLVDPLIPDKLSWYYTKNGLFTVRSAYHLQLDRRDMANDAVGQAVGDAQDCDGKDLWKVKVPPRVKEFIWRASREILPCKVISLGDRLRKKIVATFAVGRKLASTFSSNANLLGRHGRLLGILQSSGSSRRRSSRASWRFSKWELMLNDKGGWPLPGRSGMQEINVYLRALSKIQGRLFGKRTSCC